KGYGHVMLWTLPLTVVGFVTSIVRIKSPAYRVLLVALFCAPVGGAIVAVTVTRVLLFVVPLAMLTAIGAARLLAWVPKRVPYAALALPLFAGLVAVNVWMMSDSLANGPTWYTNYGLYGMQWGGPQISAAVLEEMDEDPSTHYIISPTWANGTDTIVDFFLKRDARVRISSVDSFLNLKLGLDHSTMLVMTPDEYDRAIRDPKLTDVFVERTVKSPDGRDGFFFVRMRYSDEADAIFLAEAEERRKPVSEPLDLDGETLETTHSRFEAGRIQDLFDDDTYTFVRGLEANPLLIDVTFPSPRQFSGLTLTTGTFDSEVTVRVYRADGNEAGVYNETFRDKGADPTLKLEFPDMPDGIVRVVIGVRDIRAIGSTKMHIREIKLR
ncbi:MAG TPA: hypothetical protein VIH21_13035, partial [Dehalococcoidia bacterium]